MAQSRKAKKIQIELGKKGSTKKLSSKELHAIDNKNFRGSEIAKDNKFFEITDTKRINDGKDVLLIATRNSITKEKTKVPVTRTYSNAPNEVVRL